MATVTATADKKVNKSFRLPRGLADDVEHMAIDRGELTCRMVEKILADAVKAHNERGGDGR